MLRYDVIIAGAGTAGLSAAIYGLRAGKSVLILEGKSYGGQIINTPKVENYPGVPEISGFEFAKNLHDQAEKLGAAIEYAVVTGFEKQAEKIIVSTREKSFDCQSFVIATGAKNRPLGVEREEALIGKGISYCATCDGAFFRGKEVAVVGGGNTALEDAMFLSNYCKKVTVIHRRDTFRGEEALVKRLKEKENVCFELSSEVTALHGEDKLSKITIRSKKNQKESDLLVEGLFVAVGQVPANEVFAQNVHLDAHGYVVATEDCHTNIDGVFAAGDCRTKKVRQLTTAAADGAVAGLAACEWCDQNES